MAQNIGDKVTMRKNDEVKVISITKSIAMSSDKPVFMIKKSNVRRR